MLRKPIIVLFYFNIKFFLLLFIINKGYYNTSQYILISIIIKKIQLGAIMHSNIKNI